MADAELTRSGKTAVSGATSVVELVSTSRFAEVEADWRALEAKGIESPGQSFDFLSTWISAFSIPEKDQQFIVARLGDKPIVALALHRTRSWGLRVLETFPGGHVGTNAPLVDVDVIAAMAPAERAALWATVGGALGGADLGYLCCLPTEVDGKGDLFGSFGVHATSDGLYRAVFASWEACDSEQRNRSRRKHDKQQGAKLAAMGEVSFEVLGADDDVDAVLERMFAQRGARFAQQGIADPFAGDDVRDFYRQVFSKNGGRLHVLRLNGEIVAVRYNLTHGARMFCLISSMSVAPEIQPGSPGKQCLLRVMQSEFDNGYTMFDMGSGLTDEKRHWCNVHMEMRHHYLPLTLKGQLFTQAHRAWQKLKVSLKSNDRLFALYKDWRVKVRGRSAG